MSSENELSVPATSDAVQTYLITGAHQGVGHHLVEILSARPNTVIISTFSGSVTDSPLHKLASERHNVTAIELSPNEGDLISDLSAKLEKIPNLKIDFCIFNCPSPVLICNISEIPSHKWLEIWRRGASSPIMLLNKVRNFLAPQNKIVFISSLAGPLSQLHAFPHSVCNFGISQKQLSIVVRKLSVMMKESSIIIAMNPGAIRVEVQFVSSGSEVERVDNTPIKWVEARASAIAQLRIYDNLKQQDSGKFFSYNGDSMTTVRW